MMLPTGERRVASLPRGVPIFTDESFPSYVDRVAAAYDISLGRLLRQFDRNDGRRGMLVGYGVTETPERMRRISALFRLRQATIEGALVTHFAGGAIPCGPLDSTNPHHVIRRLQAHWVFLRHSHFCPHCLAARDGAWKLAWQLPWSFVCTEHNCLLIDRCPSCGHLPRSGGPLVRMPNFRELVPIPGLCFNGGLVAPDAKRASRKPCLHDLTQVPTTPLWARLVSAQRTIEQMIDANDGERAAPFFSDLRALSALLLGFGERADFRPMPDTLMETLEGALQGRDLVREEAERKLAQGVQTRYKPYSTTPQSAKLMAVVATTAVELVEMSDAELASSLAPLARRLQHHNRRAAAISYAASPRLSAVLADARDMAVSFARRTRYPHHGTGHRALSRVGMRASGRRSPLEVRHIPQLLWRDDYEARFADLFVGVTETHGRGFCSICLAKLVGGLSWFDAADHLGLHGAHHSMVYRVQQDLAASNRSEEFYGRLRTVAESLSRRPALVDYSARRSRMSQYTSVGDDHWTTICKLAGIRRTATGGRRRYSAVWLWAEYTCGDPLRAPAMQFGRTAYVRQHWRRFLHDDLPRLEEGLRYVAADFA